MDDNGNISWTKEYITSADNPSVATKNIKGPRGDDGSDGSDGDNGYT